MNSDRIKEIQETTAYPESVSVKLALLQVWNECEQQQNKIKETDAKLIAAPEMFEALKRVEAYLVANEDVLAPFPTRSELDNIRAAMVKTGLYQYGG